MVHGYFFLQCLDERCRFRFPASAAEAQSILCPRCGGALTVAAEATDKLSPEGIADGSREIVGLLDNIRSIHNVGSMFRTADGAGVAHLHLAGITATPTHPKLAKAALGAQETVGWSYHPNGVAAAEALRSAGYHLCALERLTAEARPPVDPGDPTLNRLALVVGNERAGVDPGILALCDSMLSLPMSGRKSSLNVAVAFGIGVYFLCYGNGWGQSGRAVGGD